MLGEDNQQAFDGWLDISAAEVQLRRREHIFVSTSN